MFYQPGEGNRVFIVVSGLTRAYFKGSDGREATAGFAFRGEVLGLGAMLGYNPIMFAQTLTDAEFVSPDTVRLLNLVRSNLEVATAVMCALAHRLQLTQRLTSLRALGNIRQRLAYDLLERSCEQLPATRRHEVKASHHDLALSVGSSREAITRSIASLREEGIIDTSRETIRISDPERLVSIISEFLS